MASVQQGPELYSSNGMSNDEMRRQNNLVRAQRERELQTLVMKRENILSQRTSNPGRRAALEAALADIEAQIAKLG